MTVTPADDNLIADDSSDIVAPTTSRWRRNENFVLGTISVIAFLIFWELSAVLGWANPLFTSSPSRILAAGYEMFRDGSIWPDLAVSAQEFVLGYGLAIIVGVPLGILMGWYSRLNAVLDPFVNALYATPRIALMPLIIIWFGIDLSAKIAIIFLSTVFPILVNTMTGVRTMERDFVKVAALSALPTDNCSRQWRCLPPCPICSPAYGWVLVTRSSGLWSARCTAHRRASAS
jgi:ABC-type nitrate/sulfonate/bicarbonate transport system permease component